MITTIIVRILRYLTGRPAEVRTAVWGGGNGADSVRLENCFRVSHIPTARLHYEVTR